MKIVRFLLFPLAILYGWITSIRNVLYNLNFFSSSSFEIPVIAVGNLSVGGTGKTPQIEYLVQLLQDTYKVAILSRGYKRKTKRYILLNNTHTAIEVGDEPLQFFKKFPKVFVAVDANRTKGIQQLLVDVNPDVILLDDAFQHRRVKASFYILLTKFNDLYTDDFLLPTGNLRESRRGSNRANVIVVTKCPENMSEEEQEKLVKKIKPNSKQHVFFSSILYSPQINGFKQLQLNELKGYKILLITGIANPGSLLNFFKKNKYDFEHIKYPDHHNFTEKEIATIKARFQGIKDSDKILLTTEKDYMRLSSKIEELCYLEITNQFLGLNAGEFDRVIKSHCNTNF